MLRPSIRPISHVAKKKVSRTRVSRTKNEIASPSQEKSSNRVAAIKCGGAEFASFEEQLSD